MQYSDGRSEKLTEHFDSPEHALAVIRRMLHASGMVLDNACPLVTGHLTRNTRIAAMKSPVVDEDVGVAASIRIVNRHTLSREDLQTAVEENINYLNPPVPVSYTHLDVYKRQVPDWAREEADIAPDAKLDCHVDEGSGVITVCETFYDHDLSDIPAELLEALRKSGCCLSVLEDMLMDDDVIYDK